MICSNSLTSCPRLIDYLVIVGRKSHAPGSETVQDPHILRCYPEDSHSEFQLPKDVVYFCQPERCISGQISSIDLGTTSFVFTLTDKDSGIVRFGTSLNFYRICRNVSESSQDSQDQFDLDNSGSIPDQPSIETDSTLSRRETILTSLCLISHYPFFSKFRECLYILKNILDAGNTFFDEINQGSKRSQCNLWDLLVKLSDSSETESASPSLDYFREVEFWILRLLSTPGPVPEKSCIQIYALPDTIVRDPLVFALPDKTRLSLVDFPLHLPLELLGVETCLKVLTAIMLEQKVILQSRDYNALTMSVMAFTALLYPLQYMFPAIPLLPNSLDGAENLLLSPTPYLIGIPATFLAQKKQFLIPPDVWLVDLDANRMMGSTQIDPIPPLPPLEGRELVRHLEQALASMRSNQLPLPMNDTESNRTETNANRGTLGPACNDVDVADVATRVAMVQFFNSANVLANLSEHTRTIRLYPRPVVAFQYYSFLKSRQNLTPFTRRLAQTQAVEFLSEWSLYPENEVFQRIYAGITDPALIGDKAKWFSSALPQITFPVWTKNTGALIELALCWAKKAGIIPMDSPLSNNEECQDGAPPVPDFDYARYREQCRVEDTYKAYCPPQNLADQLRGAVKSRMSVRRRKKTRPSEVMMDPQHQRDSSQFGSVPDDRALAAQFTFDQSQSAWDASGDSSSEMSDADIWDLAQVTETLNDQTSGSSKAVTSINQTQTADSTNRWSDDTNVNTNIVPSSSTAISSGTVKTHSRDSVTTDQAPKYESTTNVDEGHIPIIHSRDEGAEEANFESEGDVFNMDEEDEMEEASVGKLLLTNLSENLADAASQASSTLSGFLDKQKIMVKRSRGFARKVVTELKHDGRTQPTELSPEGTANHEDAPKTPSRSGLFMPRNFFSFTQSAAGFTERGATKKETTTADTFSFHTDPDRSFKDQEFLRTVVQTVREGRVANYSTGTRLRELLTDENYRSYLISKIHVGRIQPIGDPECTLADVALPSEAIYKSFNWLLQCMLRGLEQTCTNHGIGGLASAMAMLEVCHTHYVDPNNLAQQTVNRQSTSDERRGSRQGEENIVDSLTGWWRSTTKDLRPKLPLPQSNEKPIEKSGDSKLGSRFTNQMAGFFSKANRLIGSSSAESAKEATANHMPPDSGSESVPVASCTLGSTDQEQSGVELVNNSMDSSAINQLVEGQTLNSAVQRDCLTKQKSRLAGSYRYVSGKLIACDGSQTTPDGDNIMSKTDSNSINEKSNNKPNQALSTSLENCTRVYLYEAFLRPQGRSRLWDHMQFWEDTFFDTVAQERDVLGLDQAPMEMLAKFGTLNLTEKRILQCQEDRLLATCLYNLIACMVMMRVDKSAIRTRIQRIQARCRLGSYFSHALSHLLDQLQYLDGNGIDLLPTLTRCSCLHVFQVTKTAQVAEDPKIFEVYQKCIIVRELTGAIMERLDYSASLSIMLSADERLVVITLKRNGIDVAESYYSDQAKQIHTAVKSVLESMRTQTDKALQ